MPAWLARLRRRFGSRPSTARLNDDPRLQALYQRCRRVNARSIATQPVSKARFVVIDTETTGLHAYSGDEVISIALLEVAGLEYTGRKFIRMVDPKRAIPEGSTRIHGIGDHDVRGAPDMDTLIADIIDFIGESVLVGHHIDFDLRFLNKTLHRLINCKLRNPCLDTMLLYLGHSGRMGHYTLEEVAQYCAVPITQRHTAYGDAYTTAQVFSCLADRLAKPDQPVSHLIRQQDNNKYV